MPETVPSENIYSLNITVIIITPMLHLRKLRHAEVKQPTCGFVAKELVETGCKPRQSASRAHTFKHYIILPFKSTAVAFKTATPFSHVAHHPTVARKASHSP